MVNNNCNCSCNNNCFSNWLCFSRNTVHHIYIRSNSVNIHAPLPQIMEGDEPEPSVVGRTANVANNILSGSGSLPGLVPDSARSVPMTLAATTSVQTTAVVPPPIVVPLSPPSSSASWSPHESSSPALFSSNQGTTVTTATSTTTTAVPAQSGPTTPAATSPSLLSTTQASSVSSSYVSSSPSLLGTPPSANQSSPVSALARPTIPPLDFSEISLGEPETRTELREREAPASLLIPRLNLSKMKMRPTIGRRPSPRPSDLPRPPPLQQTVSTSTPPNSPQSAPSTTLPPSTLIIPPLDLSGISNTPQQPSSTNSLPPMHPPFVPPVSVPPISPRPLTPESDNLKISPLSRRSQPPTEAKRDGDSIDWEPPSPLSEEERPNPS